MRGYPYTCPNCQKGKREGQANYKQNSKVVTCITYSCGTKLYITLDPPRYTSELFPKCDHELDNQKDWKIA